MEITTGNIKMQYARFGEGEKTLVILPGLSVNYVSPSAGALKRLYAPWLDGWTVYLFDRRTNVGEKYTVGEMASDTAEVMKALGIKNAAVYGASQGGMIAQLLAADHPELVSKLVLASTTAKVNDTTENVLGKWIAAAKTKDARTLNAALLEDIYSDASKEKFGEAFLNLRISSTAFDRFITMASSIPDFDAEAKLPLIGVPTLVVGCRNDRVVGYEAIERLARLGGFRLFTYGEEYSHAVYDEAPDFPERMFAFLNGD